MFVLFFFFSRFLKTIQNLPIIARTTNATIIPTMIPIILPDPESAAFELPAKFPALSGRGPALEVVAGTVVVEAKKRKKKNEWKLNFFTLFLFLNQNLLSVVVVVPGAEKKLEKRKRNKKMNTTK